MIPIFLFIIIVLACFYFFAKSKRVVGSFDPDLQAVTDGLEEKILFYNRLPSQEKQRFKSAVAQFLGEIKITAVNTIIDDTDRLYIAVGAVIPVFHFPGWHYRNLKEVLIYADTFNRDFQSTGNEQRDILGMVGSGYMEGKMLLSKRALESGFTNASDKNNTVIHEFVHLIDKSDGETDGVPGLLLDKQYVLPWIDLIHKEIKNIVQGRSDIDPYAYTNQAEFFAVVAEYFFERPDLLEQKHPQLYSMLQSIFKTTEPIS